ncbi:MAG TPA: hypothetical protein VJW20_18995 [Candidatus Angelobacter sp.]|nr:hypothetical protein [Candidatus Angelobacter sp.]
MSPETLFRIQLVLGYVAWLLFFRAYVMPRFRTMGVVAAQRAIATLHSFRFFGLVFILPGFVGPNLPASFATFAAYWDFATGVLAILALLTVRIRPLFWLFVVAFNLVGAIDLIVDYYHAIQSGLPAIAGQLGAAYVIPVIYVPLLMITHVAAFYLLLRRQPKTAQAFVGETAAA